MPYKKLDRIKSVSKLPKSEYHHGNLHDTLISAAERMLDSGSQDALSLRGLAREAGVSQTAPYRHFEDKNALLIKVATRGFRDFADALQQAVDDNTEKPPHSQLEALALAYVNFALSRSGVFSLMFLSDLLPRCDSQELAETSIKSFRVLTTVVAACQGKATSLPTDATVVASWAMMHGLAMLLTHDVIHPKMTGGMTREQVAAALCRMMLFNNE